jgi:GTPase
LTQGVFDNGQGKARLNLFRYLHEFRSGKTSSICLDIVGFSSDGQLVNYKHNTLEEIVDRSTKIITLIDLAGDSKYLKTTIYGVSSLFPHYCALIVNARVGPTLITKEHLGLAIALNIPIFIIVTKIDNASSAQVEKVLKCVECLISRMGTNRVPKRVKIKEDAVTYGSSLTSSEIVPIFSVSNVTGENFDLLMCFLNVLPPATSGISKLKQKQLSCNRPLFSVEEIFRVPKVGLVLCGILTQGVMSEGDAVQIGPDSSGAFHLGKIDSIRRNKQPVMVIRPGEAASVAVSFVSPTNVNSLRRGIVIMSAKDAGVSCKRFVARFYLLYHPATEICIGFQGTVYLGTLCRTATIVEFDPPSIQPCVWVNVVFEFYRTPEFVLVGTPLIFRMGQTKGMGEVISVTEELTAKLSDS